MLKASFPPATLSFRPQGEILDPSHPFGMTTRSQDIATQSLTGEIEMGVQGKSIVEGCYSSEVKRARVNRNNGVVSQCQTPAGELAATGVCDYRLSLWP